MGCCKIYPETSPFWKHNHTQSSGGNSGLVSWPAVSVDTDTWPHWSANAYCKQKVLTERHVQVWWVSCMCNVSWTLTYYSHRCRWEQPKCQWAEFPLRHTPLPLEPTERLDRETMIITQIWTYACLHAQLFDTSGSNKMNGLKWLLQ